MAELSGLQVFKYLPAAKKLPEGNCKKCGHPTCMAFALKAAKGQVEISLCPYAPEEVKTLLEQSLKKPQKEIYLGNSEKKVLVGGENVLYRHDKTFVNKTALSVVIDLSIPNWQEKFNRVLNFEITRINETFKVDFVCLKKENIDLSNAEENLEKEIKSLCSKLDEASIPWIFEEDLNQLRKIDESDVFSTVKTLSEIRKKAVIEKDENFSDPVYVYFKSDENLLNLTSRASFYICKYANMLLFENFDEALFSTLMTLRQNIYTDPQKPLQVESKIYEFNNPDENALVFMTTNFALTFFAVANELEALNRSSYLVVTPSEGMSVLTAWSAEKFTAQIVAKTVRDYKLADKIKNKKIIIPGLLSHMKKEIEQELPEFEIVVGSNEAYMINDLVKNLDF